MQYLSVANVLLLLSTVNIKDIIVFCYKTIKEFRFGIRNGYERTQLFFTECVATVIQTSKKSIAQKTLRARVHNSAVARIPPPYPAIN